VFAGSLTAPQPSGGDNLNGYFPTEVGNSTQAAG